MRRNTPPPLRQFVHRLVTTISTAIALLLVTGCTGPTNQEPVMDAVAHRDVVVNFVVDTTEQLELEGWEARHGAANSERCTMDDGTSGAAYKFNLSAEAGPDHEANAQRVVDYWDSLGMDTRVVDHGGYPVVYGTGGPVQRATFDTMAAGDTYRVVAVSHCAPGDTAKLKTEFDEQRKDGERFPGDEYVPEENISDKYR